MKDALKKANNKIEKLQKSSGIAVEIVKPEQNLFAEEPKKVEEKPVVRPIPQGMLGRSRVRRRKRMGMLF